MTDYELQLKAISLRRTMLELIFNAGADHTGGGLSCMDNLNVLYNRALRVSPQTFGDPHRAAEMILSRPCLSVLLPFGLRRLCVPHTPQRIHGTRARVPCRHST